MSAFGVHDTVGEVVARRPALSRAFERAGIDYCCGGKKTLEEACRERGLDPRAFIAELEATPALDAPDQAVGPAAMSLAELADHIERTHHAYLRSALERLGRLTEKVASVHGEKDPRLHEVRDTFLGLAGELAHHMMKEERILFPMVRQLEASAEVPVFHCGTLANPIRQMELEHDEAGSALERLRGLTGGYTPPEWACDTYRAMLDALVHLEQDLHQHIHKENNVLFPRVLDMEAERQRKSPIS
jgi:regulator of cell morphogenesis and NO signaling